jgi:hypothetical protein
MTTQASKEEEGEGDDDDDKPKNHESSKKGKKKKKRRHHHHHHSSSLSSAAHDVPLVDVSALSPRRLEGDKEEGEKKATGEQPPKYDDIPVVVINNPTTETKDNTDRPEEGATGCGPCRKTPGEEKRYLWNIRGHRFGHPILIIVGAVLAMLGLGTIYAWGTLSVFVSAPGFLESTPSSTAVFIYAVSLAMIPLAMLVASFIQEKLGVMLTTMVGSTLAGLGIMVSSVATSFGALFVTWGVIAGFGIGLGYVCCVLLPAKWFPTYKGLVSGISVSAFGLGSFMFSLIIKALSNPHGVPTKSPVASYSSDPDPANWREMYHSEMTETVPKMFLVVGAISFALSFLGALTL